MRVAVHEHQVAMEDEGYTRGPDATLWAAVDQAVTAEQISAAIEAHRRGIGVYPLSVDEELWAVLDGDLA